MVVIGGDGVWFPTNVVFRQALFFAMRPAARERRMRRASLCVGYTRLTNEPPPTPAMIYLRYTSSSGEYGIIQAPARNSINEYMGGNVITSFFFQGGARGWYKKEKIGIEECAHVKSRQLLFLSSRVRA